MNIGTTSEKKAENRIRPPLHMRAVPHAIRSSTTTKLLLALSIALLPLGIISFFVALDNYRYADARQAELAQATLSTVADRIDRIFDRETLILRTIIPLTYDPADPGETCPAQLRFIAEEEPSIAAAGILDLDGRLRCHSGIAGNPKFLTEIARSAAKRAEHPTLTITEDGQTILAIANGSTRLVAVAEIDNALFRQTVADAMPAQGQDISLIAGDQSIELSGSNPMITVGNTMISRKLDSGLAELSLAMPTARLQTGTALIAVLPFLMWVAALLISAAVVHSLVTVPLARIGQALRRYAAGDRSVRLSGTAMPTREIDQFGTSFDELADAVEAHEEAMAAAVERQKMLTREVHHRVKNNLQIISSLINVYSREANIPKVVDTYRLIQRRVDALSLVHRHHFADEGDAGINLQALLSELGRALQTSPETSRQSVTFNLAIDPAWVNQDVAVAVAFLITEISTMLLDKAKGDVGIDINLRRIDEESCLLSISSAGLARNDIFATDTTSALARIVQGMARKLQQRLDYLSEESAYAIIVKTQISD